MAGAFLRPILSNEASLFRTQKVVEHSFLGTNPEWSGEQICDLSRQLLPQQRAHALAVGKQIEVKLLVRRMRVVIGQRQAEQQGVRAEDLLELVDDGNRAALANQHRFATEC